MRAMARVLSRYEARAARRALCVMVNLEYMVYQPCARKRACYHALLPRLRDASASAVTLIARFAAMFRAARCAEPRDAARRRMPPICLIESFMMRRDPRFFRALPMSCLYKSMPQESCARPEIEQRALRAFARR